MKLEQQIFSIADSAEFERLALEVYHYQYSNCKIYHDYVTQLNKPSPKRLKDIPFLPISFFKTHQVLNNKKDHRLIFKSSGTGGGNRSAHYVADLDLYEKSFNHTYDILIGDPSAQIILALLPNYIEQGESSLVYMVDHLISRTNDSLSGFFLDDLEGLIDAYNAAIKIKKKVIVFGVSYALLDLCKLKPVMSEAIIIETGGMKGRRKELTKVELHEELRLGLHCDNIYSEYGMTELLSQGYSLGSTQFILAETMHVLIREVNDPFNYVEKGKTGGVNIIDLANLHSCSFIETQDLGKITSEGFEIMGRFDNSDIRGCNLLVQ